MVNWLWLLAGSLLCLSALHTLTHRSGPWLMVLVWVSIGFGLWFSQWLPLALLVSFVTFFFLEKAVEQTHALFAPWLLVCALFVPVGLILWWMKNLSVLWLMCFVAVMIIDQVVSWYRGQQSLTVVPWLMIFVLALTVHMQAPWQVQIGGFMVLMLSTVLVSWPKSPSSNIIADGVIEQLKLTERSRIYQNIHDEVGPDLLNLIYQLEDSSLQSQAKAVMQKIRQSVADTRQVSMTFTDLFKEVCVETKARLLAANIEFTQQSKITKTTVLEGHNSIYMGRIIRELVANIIKHAGAQKAKLEAVWTADEQYIRLIDDGSGMSVSKGLGRGLKSTQKRAQKMGANITWSSGLAGGTEIEIKFKATDE